MNINQACNAQWNGATVNFFRSSPANGCGNTGEIAAIFDHEWGHGMDNNGVNPNIAGPGEAIADIYAALRLNTPASARFLGPPTCATGTRRLRRTPTTGLTGVRRHDSLKPRATQPHTIRGILGGFWTASAAGRERGQPVRPLLDRALQTARRTAKDCDGRPEGSHDGDLLDPPSTMTPDAHEIPTRLLFFAAQGVGNWYTCSVGGGCAATGGYLSVLAADDDDGNLSNGTPHMTAIRASFERHEIHCPTPAVANSGCAVAPVDASTVTLAAGPGNRGQLDGGGRRASYVCTGARAEIPAIRQVGHADNSSYVMDRGLSNARPYSYAVMAVGRERAASVSRAMRHGSQVDGANLFAFARRDAELSGGDLDSFLVIAKRHRLFLVANIGTNDLTNVRILT